MNSQTSKALATAVSPLLRKNHNRKGKVLLDPHIGTYIQRPNQMFLLCDTIDCRLLKGKDHSDRERERESERERERVLVWVSSSAPLVLSHIFGSPGMLNSCGRMSEQGWYYRQQE